ncbi:MAG: right-handed parallel beta-helix repeat-containing protein [Sedimentisphaerales bacterium]
MLSALRVLSAILIINIVVLCVPCMAVPDWVDASTYGFNATDATDALQAAINTGAKVVFVPNMGTDWIIRPIFLNSSNQEIQFANGVVVTAKRGEFHGNVDSLFTAYTKTNITLTGYGATLRMWKQDYIGGDYTPSESRLAIRLYTMENLLIQGLTIKDTGGDAICLGIDAWYTHNKNIHIKDVFCDNNYRQGISVIDAENLLIENCILNNTGGTSPQSGIDFEPDYSWMKLVNCVVRNCVFENNHLCGPLFNIWDFMDANTVSISVENCTIKGSYFYGSKVRKYLPNLVIKDCIFVGNGFQAYPPYPGSGIFGEFGPTNNTVSYSAFYGNKDGASSGYITLGTGCVTNQEPIFASTDVNNPRYMHLAETCPSAIKTGDSEGGFMGARAALVQVFYDGFESGNFTAGGWGNSGCDIQTTYKYAGTYATRFNSSDSLTKTFSTVNCKSIQVKYARYTRLCTSSSHFISEWYNGTTWTTLEDLTGNSAWTYKIFDLPAGADKNANFQIRFRTSNGLTNYAYLDDVKLVADIDACGDVPDNQKNIVDFNLDCVVDWNDFLFLIENWLNCSDPNTANCL